MKKITIALAALAATSVAVSAQQIANSDFEGQWTNCVPWTFYQGDNKAGEPSENVVGLNPAGWTISNVSGMVSFYEGAPNGLGATQVGEQAEGYNSAMAVKLTNTPNPFMEAQVVPGYLSLGTTWSTAMPKMDFSDGFKIIIENSDGGVFGGQAFSNRPEGIEFMYKRSRGDAKPGEKSTVVAYLWKGHWTQKDVPATIVMAGERQNVDMVDRDRCVLGMDMTGTQGGEVSKTDDAELIAVLTADITEDASEWTKFSAKFDYKSDATPEMINIVIAAGDYFGGADVVGKDNSLTVDDVKLVYATQLPNSGFEEGWGDCIPWTSNNNTKPCGVTPAWWTIAHVAGINGTMGKTTVGGTAEGRNGGQAIMVQNSPNSIVKTQIVPGYATLGTPWNTAKGINAANKDGGTFGGIDFVSTPDALSFWYKRAHGTENAEEKAMVIAYTWSGQWTQADVPGDIQLGATHKVNMVDRERNILGIGAAEGGEITHTDDAKLVAKLQYEIAGDAAEWTNLVVPFEYVDATAAPQKLNVIFAPGDYFSTTPGNGNSLTVDDVNLIYYSRLSSLKVNGIDVEGFTSDKFEYKTGMPDEAGDITFDVMGKSAKAEVNFDKEARKATITVVNADADQDGEKQHVYTINFEGGTSGIESIDADNANAPVEYYNINGIKVNGELAPGLYVRRQGTKTTKVVVK